MPRQCKFQTLTLAALLAAGGAARAQDAGTDEQAGAPAREWSGHVRGIALGQRDASAGPLAAANRVQPGTAEAGPSATLLQTELRAGAPLPWGHWRAQGTATLQARERSGGRGDATAWVNEAYAAGSGAGWQWSLGKKVVSWDVGYAFRPNDVVQQEVRRVLVPVTLSGRPVVMAEHFAGDAAWALVWANPLQSRQAGAPAEPALALRYYRRDGALDWHGFARWGARTGASVGAAVAWVASDALELHASWRAFAHADRIAGPTGAQLAAANPWQHALSGGGQQLLLGGTWTSASQVSLLAEAWWDGAAARRGDWAAWRARNAALPGLLAHGAPAPAVAGNLAWQAQGLAPGTSLQRANLYARLSYKHEAWEPSLDMLYTPQDRGRIATAALTWQGDRVKVEGGLRAMAGPEAAVVRQLPVQRQGFVAVTWAF